MDLLVKLIFIDLLKYIQIVAYTFARGSIYKPFRVKKYPMTRFSCGLSAPLS